MQVVERIRSSYTFQVHKVIRMSGEGFQIKRSLMCTKILLMIYSFSVTSRRGPPTSRRQISVSLPRRDVDFQRHDVDFHYSLSHREVTSNVATSNCILSVTSRRGFLTSRRGFYDSLSRRDVVPHIVTTFNYMLFHVATLNRTSRRWL